MNGAQSFICEARDLLRGWGWRRGLVAAGTTTTLHATLLPSCEFEFLFVIQKRGDLGVSIFADHFHLLAGGWNLAGAKCFHLAAPFLKQGPDLGLLVRGQGEGFGELAEFTFGVGSATALPLGSAVG